MYKLSPSDFAYLYEECKHCYYLKIRRNIGRPSGIFPGVFSAINTRLQGNMIGKDLRELSATLPEGIVESQEGFVESEPVAGTQVYVKGKYDLLLGHKTYDIFAGYWPTHSDGWPVVNKITKYAVSSSLKKPSWENTVVIKDVKELKKLKNSNGPDLQVYGSANLVQSLMENDLVDEYWLKIFPITLGSGKRLFDKGTIPASFTLVYSKISPSGVIFANFKRAGNVKTGSVG